MKFYCKNHILILLTNFSRLLEWSWSSVVAFQTWIGNNFPKLCQNVIYWLKVNSLFFWSGYWMPVLSNINFVSFWIQPPVIACLNEKFFLGFFCIRNERKIYILVKTMCHQYSDFMKFYCQLRRSSSQKWTGYMCMLKWRDFVLEVCINV